MFEPIHINTLARKAHALTLDSGDGHTIYAVGTSRKRYVVGGLTTRIYPISEAVARLRAAVRGMAHSCDGITADTLGCWEDGGSVYLDLGTVHSDRIEALSVAQGRGKLAIYDTWTNEAIRVDAVDHLHPSHPRCSFECPAPMMVPA